MRILVLRKNVLREFRVSGTVLMFQLMQKSPTNAYIGQNPRKWKPRKWKPRYGGTRCIEKNAVKKIKSIFELFIKQNIEFRFVLFLIVQTLWNLALYANFSSAILTTAKKLFNNAQPLKF